MANNAGGRIGSPAASLGLAVILLALLLVLVVVSLRPPPARGPDTPPDEFAAIRAYGYLEELLAEGVPHPVGSAENTRVRDRIVTRLESFGYTVELQQSYSCGQRFGTCAPVVNILTRKAGRGDASAVLLVSHYDSVPVAPGAGDDGSSVAAMLEIARILAQEPAAERPIILLFTDGEEAGLLGAEAFVNEHPWVSEVSVAINLEARGSSGPSFMFETSDNNAWLMSAFAAAIARPYTSSVYFEVYRRLPNDTDFSVFKRAGIAGYNFAFVDDVAHYHTPLDDLDHLSLSSLQHQGDNALAMVRSLAGVTSFDLPTGNATYIDLFGRSLLIWSESLTPFLAVVGLLLLFATTIRLVTSGRTSIRAVARGVLVAVAIIIATGAFGALVSWAVPVLTDVATPWRAHPIPMRLTIWASVFFSGTVVATWLAPRVGFWGAGAGVWLFWALAGVLLAWSIPGVSVIVLLPVLLAGVVYGLVVLFPGLQGTYGSIAPIVSIVGAAVIAFPLAILMEQALGLVAGVAIALSLTPVTTTLVPLFDISGARSLKWVLPVTAGVLTTVGFTVALMVPPYSAEQPQPVNILYFEDSDHGVARWVVGSEIGGTRYLPEELLQAASFTRTDEMVLPWLRDGRSLFVAEAVPSGRPPPKLELLGEQSHGDARVIETVLRTRAPDGAVVLMVPSGAGKSILEVAGQVVRRNRRYPILNPEYEPFTLLGIPPDGLPLTLTVGSTEPIEILLIEIVRSLPSEGRRLVAARGVNAVPIRGGDTTMILTRITL